ncbi:FkbM family methyltransferase [Candidatus Pelagibacter sp.]|nr:FkbM family methyltransferase [Candidatus Pelagibacter sp.]
MKFLKKIKSFFFHKRIKYHDIKKFLNPGDLFFDVGAHLGNKSKELIKNKINVVMIEPQPECLEKLRKLYSDNPLVKIVPKGLGKSKQKLELNINSEMPVISTFAKHWKSGRFSDFTWDKKVIVDITTLDDLIEEYGNPKFIKIDVEGFEHEVLLGLTKKSGIISFEFASEFIENAFESIDYLVSLGYSDFNYSLGERRKFYTNWANANIIKENIKKNIIEDSLLWGDFYCK